MRIQADAGKCSSCGLCKELMGKEWKKIFNGGVCYSKIEMLDVELQNDIYMLCFEECPKKCMSLGG